MNRHVLFFSSLFVIILLSLLSTQLHAEGLRAPEKLPTSPSAISSPPDQTGPQEQLLDIYGPIELPAKPPYMIYGALAAVIIAGLALILFLLKKVRHKNAAAEESPAERALAALQSAEANVRTSGMKPFATEISRILRHYIERTFTIPTTSQTTSEFFTYLKTPSCAAWSAIAPHQSTIEHCLQLCDMVKYAQYQPEETAAASLVSQIRSFIESTRTDKLTEERQ